MHVMMSIVFGLAHGAVFAAADINSSEAAWGLLFGAVHWAMSGMALAMLPLVHPRVRSGDVDSPGPFALHYPPMTAMGFLVLHLLFGVLVGIVYGSAVS